MNCPTTPRLAILASLAILSLVAIPAVAAAPSSRRLQQDDIIPGSTFPPEGTTITCTGNDCQSCTEDGCTNTTSIAGTTVGVSEQTSSVDGKFTETKCINGECTTTTYNAAFAGFRHVTIMLLGAVFLVLALV